MHAESSKKSFIKNAKEIFQQNTREFGMYFALIVIMTILTIITKGVFISPRNITNLINQTGYIVVLAVGMTLVIIIRHIDLSVGYLSGFLGAIAGIAMTRWHLPVYLTIPLILGFGILAGLVSGFLVAQMRIPAFVATLAGWLGYRGALQLATMAKGTIIIPNAAFNAISNDFIPDIPDIGILPGVHKLTLILGVLAIIIFIISAIRDRRKMIRTNSLSRALSINFFILKLVFVSALIGGITWLFAGYQGLSWTAVVLLIVILFYNFITSQTVLGRHIYAVGGNPEAAELSGISVKKITYVVFCSMGMLAALSGIMFASRLRSATTTAGQLFELDAIAAAFVGGVSMSGGIGKVTGSFIGAFIMMSLTSGMNLMGIDISLQYIVRATVLAAAVIFDVAIRRREK
ncbi:MAG: sugar ABC transporter permease [Firmicutes bacterium]|nr:sugar ABC transporter permease [Bacillota bacterium]